ncbi:MAG: DNA repair ATPase [Verrucomicrobiales bacterium]
MAEQTKEPTKSPQQAEPGAGKPSSNQGLDQGTYEIIRQRLTDHGRELRSRLQKLNEIRQDVFGSIQTTLLATDRVTTANKCFPRDMAPLGRNLFIFGYNVHLGLKTEMALGDAFAIYELRDNVFHAHALDLISDEQFITDFKNLYRYYKNTVFSKFFESGPYLYMVFQVGKSITDVKTFKWLLKEEKLVYQGNRSDHEFKYPPQHEFEWKRTHRDLHRAGLHPHISVDDRLFVETIHGDLTIKIEDNTDTGEGIYSEPVDNADQTLDDAEIFYALVGNLVLLKIRPYQEKQYRYLIYNEKMRQIRRIDAIEKACVLLPDGQGIIYPKGYYLQTGEFKEFDANPADMLFERRIQSPNGEDHLYVFYNPERGEYIMMSYNVIEQKVETPLSCGGFSYFENGHCAVIKGSAEPQKHHVVQIWQTPFISAHYEPPVKKDSALFKIGNPEIVRCMAECHEVLVLLNKDDSYGNLYVDILKESSTLLDSYFWLADPATANLAGPLQEIRKAAQSALEEFDKVLRLRKTAAERTKAVTGKASDIIKAIPYSHLNEVNLFVQSLAALREIRGELISLKDIRYVDPAVVDKWEKDVSEHSSKLSNLAVEFLAREDALDPYHKQAGSIHESIGKVTKVTEARKIEDEIGQTSRNLEMLIDVVSNLKIEDATRTTAIVDRISGVYSSLNQSRALLKQTMMELRGSEAIAEFASQLKLLDQGVINYIDLCDSAAKCDEYQTKLLVQVEELEGRFADFEDFVTQLSEKRVDIAAAFDTRKTALLESRQKKANGLAAAAERILKGIKHRLLSFKSVAEINGYFASDLMVEKARDIVEQLLSLDDTVKAEDLQSQLKSIREEAVRLLRDKQDLIDDQNLVKFGKHKFTFNNQELELAMVQRETGMFLHLVGTNFYEAVTDTELLASKTVWDQELISENKEVYRAEYLAFKFFQHLQEQEKLKDAATFAPAEQLAQIQQFMAGRFAEGYIKGVHDHDAAAIFQTLATVHFQLGLLQTPPIARACAVAFWTHFTQASNDGAHATQATARELLGAKLRSFGLMTELFPAQDLQRSYIDELASLLSGFVISQKLFPEKVVPAAAEYLFHELISGREFSFSQTAATIVHDFHAYLKSHRAAEKFASARKTVESDFNSTYRLLRDWAVAFLQAAGNTALNEYTDEATCLLLRGSLGGSHLIKAEPATDIKGLLGVHPAMQGGILPFHYHRFGEKLLHFENHSVPAYRSFEASKKRVLEHTRQEMRLESFKPKVLTSFVRNRLIDSVYLPLIGDNLAKQIGSAGSNKRTDRMGMLLLISPPGYGKTTLMEYIASRLGLIFMKINGPALGDKVTALDPAVAPNAAAREEIDKLNLALEMGDNIMLYLDDIQHCNPELLQKFISLCDAQRRIEGVYKGKPRNYDLRGKKVAVVMAGNPYTESGEKFKIPDMLANRADTYNLGDIIGQSLDAFKSSYLENAITSNPVLNKLSGKGQKDILALIELAENGPTAPVEFEGNYSAEEVQEIVNVLRKMIRIREVILKVNAEYIRSAAQAEAYRTEPPFKLQGSYRNMNRLSEKVAPVMNETELEQLIDDHYKNEAQTLATGAEANLLKYREILGKLSPEDQKRWDEIKKTFKKTSLLRSSGESDPVSMVVQQLSNFGDGLDSIKDVLALAVTKMKEASSAPPPLIFTPPVAAPSTLPALNMASFAPPQEPVSQSKGEDTSDDGEELSISPDTLQKIWDLIEAQGYKMPAANSEDKPSKMKELVIKLAKHS